MKTTKKHIAEACKVAGAFSAALMPRNPLAELLFEKLLQVQSLERELKSISKWKL